MIERFENVEREGRTMETFVVHPDSGGPHPAVILLMDAPGMREEIRDHARRLASAGYWVAAPHLYYREVDHYNLFGSGDRERLTELMDSLSNQMVADDFAAVMDLADTDSAASSNKVGTFGYCMSGPFCLYIAGAFPDRVAAAASIHGVRLVTDQADSPHSQITKIKGELYLACAETDEWATPQDVEAYRSALDASSTVGRVEWYPGTLHGFSFAERGDGVYVKAAAERHWERLHDLFRRNLHST